MLQKQLVEAQSEKLSEQLHMLEKSYTELEQFSYIASHDLKSPLRTIASYAGLLRRRYSKQFDTDANEFIDYIVKAASHMNDIIRDLLEYAGINKERELESVDMHEIITLVMQNLSGEISESQAEITTNKLPIITAHRTGVLQLFQNLIANAIKFRSEKRSCISVQAEDCGAYWQFTVADNGLGLDESFQEKAFLPFQRVNYLDRPGTGMGLAICKKIVHLHKGKIWYESQIGAGTTFYFTFAKNLVELEDQPSASKK
ncbi:MAG: ATP-binding protein, partial [Saprospiraceae bacterium]|nr:ATP-binding protein [Saprospiraceae bacterium]